jgi:hypothetical protein
MSLYFEALWFMKNIETLLYKVHKLADYQFSDLLNKFQKKWQIIS